METKGVVATILGIIILIAFGVFTYYLVRHIGDGQQQWDRLIYVFGGAEAVAFAAAGYFFGKEVHRERAEKAEDKAKKAEEAAKEDYGKRSEAETKLSSLVKYIESQAPQSSAQAGVLDDLLKQARRAGIEKHAPDFMASIETKHSTAGAILDERWDALERFAKSL